MTLTCDELADLLLDFVGDELEAAQVTAFKTHLCGCKPCEKTVELYRLTITVTRALPKADALPPALEQRLRAALAGSAGAG